MTFNPRGLLVTAAFGLVLWAAADLRWALAAVAATTAFDWMTLSRSGADRRR
jgi:hypothetical protein